MKPYALSDEFVDPETERSLLAAIVANQDVYFSVIDYLSEQTFSAYPDDFLSVANAIENREPLPVIDELPPPHPDPETGAKHLCDLMQKRLMAEHLQRLLVDLRTDKSASELKDQLQDGLSEIEHSVKQLRTGHLNSITDLMPQIIANLSERYQRAQASESGMAGLSSGIKGLDMMVGGLQDYMMLLAGPPGMGKTTLALNIATAVARSGAVALYVSAEEPIARLAGKCVASSAKMEFKRFEDGLADPNVLTEAAKIHASALRTLFFLEGNSKTTVNEIRATYLRAKNKTGSHGTALIVIDYLQKICSSVGNGEYRHIIDSFMDQVNDLLVKREKVCVLMLAAQNRAGQGTGSTTSIRDGGDYGGDVIALLCNNSERTAYDPDRAVDLVIGKNRRGGSGRSIKLTFDQAYGIFTEVDEQQD
jgi:replicative DNA helicase